MILNWLIILFSVSILVFPRTDRDDADSRIEPSFPEVTLNGRYDVIEDGSIALIGSASSVEFTVQGDSVVLLVQSEYVSGNSLVVTINDLYQGRYLLRDNEVRDIRIGLSRSETSKIGIFKATEAATGNLIIRSIEADGPLEKVPARSKTIEFIGNSITCGAAADTQTIPCGTGYYHDQHNAYLAYGPRVARSLDADYFLSSVSGIGIYRNWNDEHKNEPIMPEVYENLYLNGPVKKPYSFSVQPDLVSVCLGTNDLSAGDGTKKRLPFDRKSFISNYVAFVKNLRSHYPGADIVLLSSPIVQGRNHEILVGCLREVQQLLSPQIQVSVFEFEPFEASGCTGHPSIDDHQRIAEELMPAFEKLLNPKSQD